MSDIINVADHAARQSDRWLFVAMLVIFMIAVATMVRWFIGDREKLSVRLTEVTDKHIAHTTAQTERMSEVIANNTAALQSNAKALEKVNETMVFCRGKVQQ